MQNRARSLPPSFEPRLLERNQEIFLKENQEIVLFHRPRFSVPASFLPTTHVTRAHAAHITITALAAMDGPRAGELYNTLRTAYNLARLPAAAPIPPLEEWQGVSHCCGSCYCRCVRAAGGDSSITRKTEPYYCSEQFQRLFPRVRTRHSGYPALGRQIFVQCCIVDWC